MSGDLRRESGDRVAQLEEDAVGVERDRVERLRSRGSLTVGHPSLDHTAMAPRHFSRKDANALLPELRPLVERLAAHRRKLVAAQRERVELTMRVAGNGSGLDSGRLTELDDVVAAELAGVARCANAIHALGAVVKDPESGLVDFPARIEGQEAFLCWQLGEDEVAWWHGLDEGFAGRKPLDP